MAFQADSIFWVEVEKIVPNPFQPRREFDEAKLKELAESVRMYGILQPLTVTKKEIVAADGSFRSEYELIAGERRLRASKLAGLQIVPVIIRDGEQTEQEKLELAIIENLQREDLNAVDRALAFRQLADVFGLSHAQVAVKVGRSREYVSNSIRLLALPGYMLDALRTNDITEGHARTLLMLNDRPEEQDVVFRETLLKKLSVREVEKIARSIATDKVRRRDLVDESLIEMEKAFTHTLGTRVSITKTEFGGRVTIDYFSVEDLEEMLSRMKKEGGRSIVSDAYRDESKDTLVSEKVDEEMATLAELARSTGIEPFVPFSIYKTREDVVLYVDDVDDAEETKPDAEVTATAPTITSVADEVMIAADKDNDVVVSDESMTSPMTPSTEVIDQEYQASEVKTELSATNTKPSLRDQLAQLLGKKSEDKVATTSSVQTNQLASVNTVPAVVSEAKAVPVLSSVTDLSQTVSTPKSDDEAGLYSVNSFNI